LASVSRDAPILHRAIRRALESRHHAPRARAPSACFVCANRRRRHSRPAPCCVSRTPNPHRPPSAPPPPSASTLTHTPRLHTHTQHTKYETRNTKQNNHKQSLARLFRPLTAWASQRYTARLGDKLRDYGLRYDDLYDPLMDADVAEALRRLDPEVVYARNARLRRAMDLSLKHEKLPAELRARQTPFEPYLTPMLNEIKAERTERAQLGSSMPYQRTLP